MMMAEPNGSATVLQRWYIDVRPLVTGDTPTRSQTQPLPLIESLPDDIQSSIRKYLRPQDRLMSLTSALLKFRFIHKTARVPWSEVQISKTDAPHLRPYWSPPSSWRGDRFEGLEFNVSHQAGITALVGCSVVDRPDHHTIMQDFDSSGSSAGRLRIGVDVACTQEPRRTPDLSSQAKLNEWVDTFTEMFSQRECWNMKFSPVQTPGNDNEDMETLAQQVKVLEQKARRFYAYWALKEAYIKMVGTGLLAEWLTQLEFTDVVPPPPGQMIKSDGPNPRIFLMGREITETVRIRLDALDSTFLLATITTGVLETGQHVDWMKLDIDRDVRDCAEGHCSCLI